jgi:prepilin-type N-terminal cleavage/methylation domain-containing protein
MGFLGRAHSIERPPAAVPSRAGRPARSAPARRGVTLLESLIALVVVSTVFLAVSRALDGGVRVYRAGAAAISVESKARRAVERVAEVVASSSPETFDVVPIPTQSLRELSFRTSVGFAGGAVQWGDPWRVGFEYAAGELDDGIDNDGNGVADDGVLVLTRDAGLATASRLVLAGGVREDGVGEIGANGLDDDGDGVVDEGGFSIDLEGDVLTIRLALEGRDPEGRPISRTAETSVRLRNG